MTGGREEKERKGKEEKKRKDRFSNSRRGTHVARTLEFRVLAKQRLAKTVCDGFALEEQQQWVKELGG